VNRHVAGTTERRDCSFLRNVLWGGIPCVGKPDLLASCRLALFLLAIRIRGLGLDRILDRPLRVNRVGLCMWIQLFGCYYFGRRCLASVLVAASRMLAGCVNKGPLSFDSGNPRSLSGVVQGRTGPLALLMLIDKSRISDARLWHIKGDRPAPNCRCRLDGVSAHLTGSRRFVHWSGAQIGAEAYVRVCMPGRVVLCSWLHVISWALRWISLLWVMGRNAGALWIRGHFGNSMAYGARLHLKRGASMGPVNIRHPFGTPASVRAFLTRKTGRLESSAESFTGTVCSHIHQMGKIVACRTAFRAMVARRRALGYGLRAGYTFKTQNRW